MQVRCPTVPVVFCDSRPSAKQWVYRFLGAARAEAEAARVLRGTGDHVWDNGD
ncbi:MAG TPA: hypothetical protein VG078_04315 [Acidimicrobiales bacterium]|nr:hypothetical protein [Acidimicrobiales bacterium]